MSHNLAARSKENRMKNPVGAVKPKMQLDKEINI